jgi:hypothetical protein
MLQPLFIGLLERNAKKKETNATNIGYVISWHFSTFGERLFK